MDVQNAIGGLNSILALEYAGLFQYLQYSYLIQGPEREYLRPFFRQRAQEGFDKHSKQVAEKIVALGGTPTLQPGPVKEAYKLSEMLSHSLELERNAQRAQQDLLRQVQDDVPLRLMLEEMVLDEQQDIEYLERLAAGKAAASMAVRRREAA